MKTFGLAHLAVVCALLTACGGAQQAEEAPIAQDSTVSAEIVIYGGTSAAVTAAVQAAKMGRSVVMVCPDVHLGGLSSSGLGWSDTGQKRVIGGLSKEFYHRLYRHYQDPKNWKWEKQEDYGNVGQSTEALDTTYKSMWIFEPHAAEQVFEDFIAENGIAVYRDEWLDRDGGVAMKDGAIQTITMLSGMTFAGEVFIDATYEGDLMAAAGVSYTVGRESLDTYGEKWNGVQTGVLHHGHHFFDMNISPYKVPGDPESGVLPLVSAEDPGEYGAADDKVQAYCFRTCLTKHPDNREPFPKPEGYDPARYELVLRVFDTGWRGTFKKFDPIPNRKTDVNNHGPVSFDYIGGSYDYPEASYERRKEIIEEHERYQKGLLYFLANDPRVPEEIRTEMAKWGLAKDEFVDNGNWPHHIYVREARRMLGQFVMTEHHTFSQKPVDEPIGMGSYTLDSHNVQRYITPEGYVQNEGDIGVKPESPYAIALGSILPKPEECSNLLVPVAVSASHMAFGSIRMEPVFMILGQSAATLAAMAVAADVDINAVAYADLKKQLEADGQILADPDGPPVPSEGKVHRQRGYFTGTEIKVSGG